MSITVVVIPLEGVVVKHPQTSPLDCSLLDPKVKTLPTLVGRMMVVLPDHYPRWRRHSWDWGLERSLAASPSFVLSLLDGFHFADGSCCVSACVVIGTSTSSRLSLLAMASSYVSSLLKVGPPSWRLPLLQGRQMVDKECLDVLSNICHKL